ncbi:MAG TPA: ABC transporter ATP-binding protein [Flavobacteriales bacterium]|nr:ABC transporter ATP-binding protein [Flavobacteriales bacterium]
MKIISPYLRPYKKLIFITLLLATINQVFSLLDPFIIGKLINYYSDTKDKVTADVFVKAVLFFIALAIGAAMMSRIAKNFQDYCLSIITQKVGTDIYTAGIKHTLAMPYQLFEDQRSGETLGRLQKVKTDCERLISSFINIMFTSLVGLIFVMIISFTVNWKIALFYMAAIPIIGFLSSFLSKKIKVIQKKIVGETTALAGSTTESLRNIELVKSLGLTDQEVNRLNTNTRKILGLELKKVKYIRTLSFIQGTIINLLRNAVIVFLIYLVFKNEIKIGDYMLFFMYSFFIFNPLQEFGNIIQLYRETEVSLNNFKQLMEQPVEDIPANPVKMGAIKEMEFANVSFKHLTSTRYALKNVSFKIKTGETIAFVGPSGSGKTTLVKLLVGLYKPAEGNISYNGTPYTNIDINELRSQLGFVTQDSQLFSGTIKENLLFVKPTATDEECMTALNRAACHSLLNRADKGLDTVIGEGGIKISGGEKQRISIARALLRQPNLLVFDEATSALDSLTEEEISETIRSLSTSKEHITVLIAHRLSTIMHANTIYVFEKGAIIEYGTHEQLVNNKGLYYAMWRQQVGEAIES